MNTMILALLVFVPIPVLAAQVSDEAAELARRRQTFTYKTVEDCPIQADVYRLPGDDVRPGIVWVHGGALITGSRDMLGSEGMRTQWHRYLEAGYVVIAIDYRLAPETKLPAILDDLRDAWRWVRSEGPERFRIDPDRLAVVGHSAGGYLTLMAGFSVEPRPRALVAFYGYGDIIGDWYAKPDPFYRAQPLVSKEEAYRVVGGRVLAQPSTPNQRGRFYLYCRQNGLWPLEVVGLDPARDPRAFDRFCPLRNVTQDYPPTLLLHGDKDTDVPYEQSVLMAREFERHGVVHRLVTLQDRGHGFDARIRTDTEAAAAFETVLSFLREQMGR